jgi:hypothetical protein
MHPTRQFDLPLPSITFSTVVRDHETEFQRLCVIRSLAYAPAKRSHADQHKNYTSAHSATAPASTGAYSLLCWRIPPLYRSESEPKGGKIPCLGPQGIQLS